MVVHICQNSSDAFHIQYPIILLGANKETDAQSGNLYQGRWACEWCSRAETRPPRACPPVPRTAWWRQIQSWARPRSECVQSLRKPQPQQFRSSQREPQVLVTYGSNSLSWRWTHTMGTPGGAVGGGESKILRRDVLALGPALVTQNISNIPQRIPQGLLILLISSKEWGPGRLFLF